MQKASVSLSTQGYARDGYGTYTYSTYVIWDRVFKNGPSKICLNRSYYFKFFKGSLPQILFGPFLNTLSYLWRLVTNILLVIVMFWRWLSSQEVLMLLMSNSCFDSVKNDCTRKWSFPWRISSVKWPNLKTTQVS